MKVRPHQVRWELALGGLGILQVAVEVHFEPAPSSCWPKQGNIFEECYRLRKRKHIRARLRSCHLARNCTLLFEAQYRNAALAVSSSVEPETKIAVGDTAASQRRLMVDHTVQWKWQSRY